MPREPNYNLIREARSHRRISVQHFIDFSNYNIERTLCYYDTLDSLYASGKYSIQEFEEFCKEYTFEKFCETYPKFDHHGYGDLFDEEN